MRSLRSSPQMIVDANPINKLETSFIELDLKLN